MSYRNINNDIISYSECPNMVRHYFCNGKYPPEVESFVEKWLKFKERQEAYSEMIGKVWEFFMEIAFTSFLLPIIQAAIWLYKGEWPSFTFIKLLHYLNIDTFAIEYPYSWIGLAKIANWWINKHIAYHIILYSIIIALILSYIIYIFKTKMSEREPKLKI